MTQHPESSSNTDDPIDSVAQDALSLSPMARLSPMKRTLFGAITAISLLMAGEGVCRLLSLGKVENIAHYISDWHDSPDGQTFWVVRGPGHNEDGMRDRPHVIEKPPGIHRIVCLGDSITMGYGLPASQSYPTYFQTFLTQMSAPGEVFNVSSAGWSTLQERTAYVAIARKYRPDSVFLGFCLNDVPEMHNNMTEPPPAALRFMLRHSALVRALLSGESRQIKEVLELFDDQESPKVSSAWQRVFDELLILQDVTRKDGCTLSVVMFPFRFQLLDIAVPPVAQRKLFTFCRANDIPCLDLLPALRTIGPDAFIDESHLSSQGAQSVARELIRWGRTGCMACGFDLEKVESATCPRCNFSVSR